MTIKERPFDKYYPYEIHDGWDGVIYATEEDLKNLQKEIEKTLDKSKDL